MGVALRERRAWPKTDWAERSSRCVLSASAKNTSDLARVCCSEKVVTHGRPMGRLRSRGTHWDSQGASSVLIVCSPFAKHRLVMNYTFHLDAGV